MKTEKLLKERSGDICELSGVAGVPLFVYELPHSAGKGLESSLLLCEKCIAQIEKREVPESTYWEKILPVTIWSEIPAIQVVSWRMLNRFRNESWAVDTLEMAYLEEALLEWAKAAGDHTNDTDLLFHKDANGHILQNGDTVTLIKDLDVKGSSLTAKVGTAVRNIRLVHDNPEQIEGKIENQALVILTKFVKKQ